MLVLTDASPPVVTGLLLPRAKSDRVQLLKFCDFCSDLNQARDPDFRAPQAWLRRCFPPPLKSLPVELQLLLRRLLIAWPILEPTSRQMTNSAVDCHPSTRAEISSLVRSI